MNTEQNNEIDILSLLTTIWDGKWKIAVITIITSLISSFYLYSTPSSFKLSSIIDYDDQNAFVKFKALNDILEENNILDEDNKNKSKNKSNGSIINGELIFRMFVNEFNDYDEMINVLSKNAFVYNKIKNLNNFEKRKALANLANNFKILKPKRNNKDWEIVFQWHDIDEGILLMQSAFKLTLNNVKKKLLMDIDSLASALDNENERATISLYNKLNANRELYNLSTAKRKLYLTEQSNIAKELGIENNKLKSPEFLNDKTNFDSLNDTSGNVVMPSYALNVELPDISNFPYYLRGFKAIDKEIELIQSRSKKDKDLMTNGYLEIKKDLILIENDSRSSQLRNSAKFIIEEDFNNWFNFNLEFAKITDLKNTNLYLLFSIFFGLIISMFYIYLMNAIKVKN